MRRRLVLIVVVLSALGVGGAVFLTRGKRVAPTKVVAPLQSRPLVTLLLKCPGPTASIQEMWRKTAAVVDKPIPDGTSTGVTSDLVTDDAAGGTGGRAFDLDLGLMIQHERAADLTIELSAMSPDGKETLKTEVIWDGAAAARGKTAAEADRVAPARTNHPNSLLAVPACQRWRLKVTDSSPGRAGILKNWWISRKIARFRFAHDQAYYRRLLFGDGGPADPKLAPSVDGYFREVSRGHFTYSDAGIYGPVPWDGWDGSSDRQQVAAAVDLLESQGFDFRAFDTDHDGTVSPGELTILVIHNDGDGHDGRTRNNPGGTTLVHASLKVDSAAVFMPQQMDFSSLTHELSHTRGAVDLYGVWNRDSFNVGMTVMSATLGSPPDDKKSIYLDPWHRFKFGWIEAIVVQGGDRAELGDEEWRDAQGEHARPLIVWKSASDHSEYFLFENRSGSRYDNAVADHGIVAWHVREDAGGGPFIGEGAESPGHSIYVVSPGAPRGGSRAWKPSDGPFRLQWADGSPLPCSYRVETISPGGRSAVLRWTSAAAGK